MKQIGKKIKEIRLEQGMTLKEMGEELQFNYSNLSKIERGVRKPTVELIGKMIKRYNLDADEFFEN